MYFSLFSLMLLKFSALIIARTMKTLGDSSSIKLSQILRMYYSEHGLYNQDIRACNRHNIYNKWKDSFLSNIEEQVSAYASIIYFEKQSLLSTEGIS